MGTLMNEIESSRIYSSSELNQLGYSSNALTDLTRHNELTRLQRGFYVVGQHDDMLSMIIQLFPEVILCLNSALYFYGYLSERPAVFALAVHKNHNRYRYQHSNLPIRAYFRDDKYIDLGASLKMYHGQLIMVYDKERTICDCLRRKSLLSKKEYQRAIQSYLKDPEKDIERLKNYSKILKIDKKINFLIDVWY